MPVLIPRLDKLHDIGIAPEHRSFRKAQLNARRDLLRWPIRPGP
jgi:hypothetical protein